MRRVFPHIVALIGMSAASGCASISGLYRSAGHIPGVATTDYAFYNFCGTSSQLYQFTPTQIESSMIEALADLGFEMSGPPDHQENGEILILARAPDGRPARITITPQNSLTNVRVTIGPVHIGDQELSRRPPPKSGAEYGHFDACIHTRGYDPAQEDQCDAPDHAPGAS